MARSATVAASRWRVWVHPGRSRGNLCSTRHATGADDCLAQRSPMNWNQNSDIAVLEKHHVTYVTGFIHLQQFIWSSAVKWRGVSVVWFTVARKTLPFCRWRFHFYLRRPLIHWPWQMRRQMRLRAICQRSTGRHHGIQVMGRSFVFQFFETSGLHLFHMVSCCFSPSRVLILLHGGHREFRHQRSWRVHDRQAGTRRVQGFGKTQRKLICLANVGLKGCLHWILGPSDHQVAFAMAYFWVQPIFSIL